VARAKKDGKGSQPTQDASLAVNRAAFHNYSIEDRYEAGIALSGTEIKSIRGGRASLREGFIRIANGEAWLEGVHIAPYEHGTHYNHEPTRPRKLLLHKAEIRELGLKSQAQGYTIVPLQLLLKRGRAKVEVGLARAKRQYDKRQAIAERDAKRDVARQMRERS
jgi:SsrA-binding protein